MLFILSLEGSALFSAAAIAAVTAATRLLRPRKKGLDREGLQGCRAPGDGDRHRARHPASHLCDPAAKLVRLTLGMMVAVRERRRRAGVHAVGRGGRHRRRNLGIEW